MKSILRYLKMPSTWKGLAWLFTLLGVGLSPEQWEAISVAGVAIVAAIEMFTDEDKRRREININLPPIEMQGHSEDDGYISRDALRAGLRIDVPPNHRTGNEYDERQSGFNDQ